jgi:hypothetical protein
MSAGRGEAGRVAARNGSGLRLVPVGVGVKRGEEAAWIDEALDRLVDTVDDLAHDLAIEETEQSAGYAFPTVGDSERLALVLAATARRREPLGRRVHSTVLVVGVALVMLLLEFAVIAWLFSNG